MKIQRVKLKNYHILQVLIWTQVIMTSPISSFPIFSQISSYKQHLLEKTFRASLATQNFRYFILLKFGFIALSNTKYMTFLLCTSNPSLNQSVVFVSSWHVQNPETSTSVFIRLVQNCYLLNSIQLILTFINKPEPTDLIRPWKQHWTTEVQHSNSDSINS